jgi:hypothetical protein
MFGVLCASTPVHPGPHFHCRDSAPAWSRFGLPNSIFVGDYLSTAGQVAEADYKMIEEMGLVVTRNEVCVA